jgi:hypothetical protein
MIGNIDTMIANEAAIPPKTVAQYPIPGRLNAMSTWECRYRAADTRPTTIDTAATRRSGNALSSATTRCKARWEHRRAGAI